MKLDIERLAREAGLMYHIPFPSDSGVTVALHRFSALVLEEAAKVCDGMQEGWASDDHLQCAAAIRALKDQP